MVSKIVLYILEYESLNFHKTLLFCVFAQQISYDYKFLTAPQIIGLISFCTGMHHEYFFEVVNVLSCSFMF